MSGRHTGTLEEKLEANPRSSKYILGRLHRFPCSNVETANNHFSGSIFGQETILLMVMVKQYQTCRSVERFWVTSLFFLDRSPFLSWILCAYRNRPLSRRLSFLISHRTHLQISWLQISRLTPTHCLSRTQVLLVLAALISRCVLPSVMLQAMASLALTCLPPSGLSCEQFEVLSNSIASMQTNMQK